MKMHSSALLILAGAWTIAAAPALPEPGRLYDQGIRLTQEGKLPAARRTLETLVNTYPKSVEAADAQNAIDALLLFEDGQARLRAGKYGTASVAFQTLIAVYPESPLVPRASEAMTTSERLEQEQTKTLIVRSLKFDHVQPVKVQDILQRFEEREIELGLEKTCNPKMLEEAKSALTELLSERGVRNPRVRVTTRELPPRSVEVAFRVEKD